MATIAFLESVTIGRAETSALGTLTHTAAAGSIGNRLAICYVVLAHGSSGLALTTATDGTSSITQCHADTTIVGTARQTNIKAWYILESVLAAGSFTFTPTNTGGNPAHQGMGILLYEGVDQTSPIYDSDNHTSSTTDVTIGPTIDFLADGMGMLIGGESRNDRMTPNTSGLTEVDDFRIGASGSGYGQAWAGYKAYSGNTTEQLAVDSDNSSTQALAALALSLLPASDSLLLMRRRRNV